MGPGNEKVPVCFRVWVSGFSEAERAELSQVLVGRSLIRYLPAESAQDSDLAIVDADLAPGPSQPDADRTLHIGHAQAPGARWQLPRPVVSELTLRMLDELVARERPTPWRIADALEPWLGRPGAAARPAARAVPAPDAATSRPAIDGLPEFPPLEPIDRGDIDDRLLRDDLDAIDRAFAAARQAPALARSRPIRVAPAPAATLDDGAERLAQGLAVVAAGPATPATPATPAENPLLAERRRAPHRPRATQRRRHPRRVAGPGTTVALVVDGHAPSRIEIGALLQAFGFRAHVVATVAAAERALWAQDVDIAFVAEPEDAVAPAAAADNALRPGPQAALALCQRIKRGHYRLRERPDPKVVLLWGVVDPSDRVRARLAGCDHLIEGTATRGGLVGALDAIDLPLPRDPRQAR